MQLYALYFCNLEYALMKSTVFNLYVLSKNNIPESLTCSLYTQSWDKSYSTNVGQYRGSDYYSVSQSYGCTLNPQDSGTVSQ